ncbi:MAG: group II intron reverse transcriptase/maturase [Ktedonobacteraceae bacterium]|nr:group II intron reverse transcriptase/maturase [Ktedonobacteraceae bacterium]
MSSEQESKTYHPFEGESVSWSLVPWRKLEQHVFHLQKRIYQAAQDDNEKKLHSLQKLLLRSHAARLLAVRRVTQDNTGKKTAGVDGVKSIPPEARWQMAEQIHPTYWEQSKMPPVRRVWIPKPGKPEKRPLGIPTLLERAKQALAKLALEPEWEARFEADSYGFRPGRSAWDAIEAIHADLKQKAKYVLDTDIKGCFDHIDQNYLLNKLNTFAGMQKQIRKWLKAGILDANVFTPSEAGTPQGGVISPLLANIALHGMQEEVEGKVKGASLIRYADDFVILHATKEGVEQAKEVVERWLAAAGLHLSPQKTRIAHTLLEEGFDFLGFHVRQYPVGKYRTGKGTHGKPLGFKTLIKPSPKNVAEHVRTTKLILRRLMSAPQEGVIKELNPIIRGWSQYYRTGVSKETFSKVDHLLNIQLRQWAYRRHPGKGRRYAVRRYWKSQGQRNWVFGNAITTLLQHTDTPIQRHIKVKGTASPYNGKWLYWTRRATNTAMETEKVRLIRSQHWKCPLCKLYLSLNYFCRGSKDLN